MENLVGDMNPNPDPANGQFLSEKESTNLNGLPKDAPQMQVAARKENSSGFMLLSVKHLSKVKRDKAPNVGVVNGRHANNLEECLDDSCIAKSASVDSNYKNMRRNSLELERHFSSTASLDAEEYEDDDEEEDLEEANEDNEVILPPNAALPMQQPQGLHLTGISQSHVRNLFCVLYTWLLCNSFGVLGIC